MSIEGQIYVKGFINYTLSWTWAENQLQNFSIDFFRRQRLFLRKVLNVKVHEENEEYD